MGKTKIFFSSRNHTDVLIKNIQIGLKEGGLVEVYPNNSQAFAKAGEAIAAATLNAKCEITKENNNTKYILTPER